MHACMRVREDAFRNTGREVVVCVGLRHGIFKNL